jgi:F-type H+-transporting ATPase subunit a
MSAGLHISISAEPVFDLGPVAISNSILTSLIVSALLIIFAAVVKANLKSTNRPKGIQNVAEFIVESLYGLVEGVAVSKKKINEFFPFIATFFLFILCNNYFGLLPGVGTIGFLEKEEPAAEHVEQVETVEEHSSLLVADVYTSETTEAPAEHQEAKFVPYLRAGTADLNTTLALAITSMFLVQFFGIKHQQLGYFKKFINFSNPINFFVGVLETVSEFAKIVSFAFRLFGNIFAGEVLLAVIGFLVPVVAPMPFYGLEIFVGFIQALVFSMLSLVFFNMATMGHDEH